MVKLLNKSELLVENILYLASKHCNNYNKPLYHYTNAKGLYGIINDGEIWGSHYKFTNDPSEFIYSYKLIIEILKQYIDKQNETRIISFFEKYLNLLQEIVELQAIDLSKLYIYVASFSEDKDLLSQWRGYGDNSVGYSIGIDLFNIDGIYTGLSSVYAKDSKIFLVKIIYDEQEQRDVIVNYLDQINKYIVENENLDESSGLLYGVYLVIFPLIACLLKNPVFAEEKEWRLIYVPLTYKDNDEFNINFRVNYKIIIPYVKMNLTNENSNIIPINEIIFGPRLEETKARMGLEILLESNGYTDEIHSKLNKSSIPLS